MISSSSGLDLMGIQNSVSHQMPYELSVKFLNSDGNKMSTELILTRFLNGVIVGYRTMPLQVVYDKANTFTIAEALMKKKLSIKSWLSEQIEQQE